MTAREFSALVSAVLIIIATVWYIYAMVTGTKVRPVLASWIVLGSTMSLSFATYWTAPKHSLVSNASNAAAVISAVGILIAVAFRERKGAVFNSFQKWCLQVAGAITLFWIVMVWGFGRTGVLPNVLTQVLMIIGYLATIQKLWSAKINTESLLTWWLITIASGIALYTGIVSGDGLATLYASRATIASGTVVWLMHRIEKNISTRTASS